MRRPVTVVAVLASLTLFAPAAMAAPAAQHTSARAAACHRTLKHYPVLRPGAHRPAVRTLQCVLNDDGFGHVVVDGVYGPQTRAAVRRVEDGFEGPSPHPGRINNGFWVLLFGQHLPDRDLRFGQHGPAIRTLTLAPARNHPRPGVWSISIRHGTTASRLLGLNAQGNWLSGVPPRRPVKMSSSAALRGSSARSSR